MGLAIMPKGRLLRSIGSPDSGGREIVAAECNACDRTSFETRSKNSLEFMQRMWVGIVVFTPVRASGLLFLSRESGRERQTQSENKLCI